MKLSGYSQVNNGFVQQTFPPSGRNRGQSFLDQVMSATLVNSMEKVKKGREQDAEDAKLQALYALLSPPSKETLKRLRDGKSDIRKDEWLTLCRELKDAGAITQSEFDYTRGDLHLIPLGYYDEQGSFVKYDTSPMLKDQLESLYAQSQDPVRTWLSGNWSGDPMKYLGLWMSELEDWRKDLSQQRAADGSLKYSNFSPITDQIDACQKVMNLVQGLSQL